MKKLYLKIFAIITLISLYFCIDLINYPDIYNVFKILFIVIIALITFGITTLILEKKNMEVHKKFVVIAGFFGIILIFIIPLLHGSDEIAHFFKVYSFFNNVEEIQTQDATYDKVPILIQETEKAQTFKDNFKLIGQKINPDITKATDSYRGARLYSPIAYLPFLLPMLVFQTILNFDIFWVIIIGRFCGFIFWLIISTYTIKIIPNRKEFMAFLCLMPVILSLVTTYTADLITNSVIFLFITIWYRLYEEKRLITKKEIVLITILGIISAYAKLVYALMFLIFLLLPKENFKSKNKKIQIFIGMAVVILLAVFLNLFIVGNDMINAYPKIYEQKEYILSNPIKYMMTFFSTLLKNYNFIFCFTTNGEFAILHDGVIISDVISFLYFVILIVSLFVDKVDSKLNKNGKRLVFAIIFLIIFVLYTSLYLQFTATHFGVGSNQIWGIQIRYFIPLVAMLVLSGNNRNLPISKDYLWIGVILIDFIMILKIIVTF